MSNTSTALPRKFGLISSRDGFPGYSDELRHRAEEVANGTNLVEVILYAHLLLEQALDIRIQQRLERPDVLQGKRFARLTFAQKVTVYAGLYDPDNEQIALLQGFNKLRNLLAHSFANLEDAALECLPATVSGTVDTALHRVQNTFLWLAFSELRAIAGIRRLDMEPPSGFHHEPSAATAAE